MTLGLLGAGIVVYDLLRRPRSPSSRRPTRREDGGLIPVVVGTLVAIAALPLLALIWGARRTDLAETWASLNEGVTFGGMLLSVSGHPDARRGLRRSVRR